MVWSLSLALPYLIHTATSYVHLPLVQLANQMTGLTSSCNQRENEGILHLSPSLTNCFAARVALALKLLLPPPTMMRWAIRIEGSQTLAGVWGVTMGFMDGEAERQENKRKAKYKNLTFLYLRMRAILNRLRLERALRHPGSGSMYSTNTNMGVLIGIKPFEAGLA